MRMGRLTASKRFPTISRAQWNRLRARHPLSVGQRHFPAGAGLHRVRHQFAVVTIAVVA